MGKEAKIGLGVILILLITFGVVLAKKLGGSGDPLDVAAADEKGSNAGNPQADSGGEPQKTPIPVAGLGGRTIVPAAATVIGVPEQPPGGNAGYLASSASGTMTDASSSGHGGTSASALLPSTPAPKVGNLYGVNYPPTETNPAGQATQATASPAATRGVSPGGWGSANGGYAPDPFRNQATQTPTTAAPLGQGAVNQGSNVLRLMPSPGRPPQPGVAGEYPHATTNPYANRVPTSPQPPSDAWQRAPQTYAPLSGPTPSAAQTSVANDPVGNDAPYGTPQYADPQHSGSQYDEPKYSEPKYSEPQYAAEDARREDGRYEVQPNDNYWAISKKLYGSGGYFKALAEHNRGRIPQENRLVVGDLISAPSVSELQKSYPGLCPKPSRRETLRTRATAVSTRGSSATGRTYQVEEGDTLFDIARYELGKASRWVEIYKLNRDLLGKDFDYITPGTRLALPAKPRSSEPSNAITRTPGASSVY